MSPRVRQVAMVIVAATAASAVAAGGYFAFQTYEYVEHENEFCLSCHLMQEPYELFAQSDHRGLGCKACHQPTITARGQMALTAILENPGELSAHAEVTNERCAACHVEGDSERWESIRNSAGHRIHFESTDPALQGLMCVECHSSSLHEFAPSDRTCAQSGCHADVELKLGKMGDLTIHCAACHGFSEPVPANAARGALFAAIRPDAAECLSCHAMRQLVQLPEDEPHGGACGACHNPHEQETPGEAAASCATSACHDQPATLTAFHRGLSEEAAQDCTLCHRAHDWRAGNGQCLACHGDVFDEGAGEPVAQRGWTHPPPPGVGSARVSAPVGGGLNPTAHFASVPLPSSPYLHAPPAVSPSAQTTTFRHNDHRGVDCLSCHTMERTHGALTVSGISDCRSCHHTQPVAARCTSCHAQGPAGTYSVTRTLDLSVGTAPDRPLPFRHADHDGVGCAGCHTEGLELSAGAADCSACHQQHHRPDVRCASCHVGIREPPHTTQVHLGCDAAGCHQNLPFQGVPRVRSFCVTCHQDMEDHRPGRACEGCHALPEPRAGGGA